MSSIPVLLLLGLLLSVQKSIQASADEWRSRSIYQVVTDRFARSDGSTSSPCDPALGEYCGGTWQGLIKHLDYIQGMGFTAVWISPVTKNLMQPTSSLESYHGYWQQDLKTVNPSFGTSSDLRELADALHQRDMFLMLDVVVGTMAYAGGPSSIDYTVFNPFDRENYFHPYCPIIHGSNVTEVRECWLGDTVVSLPDLRTEDPVVAGMLYDWISDLVSNYSVDGIRVDSVANMNPEFLLGLDEVANLYCLGEVYDTFATSACGYQDVLDGFVNVPIYFSLTQAFQGPSGSMAGLIDDIAAERSACKNLATVATFSENHDMPRFAASTSDLSLAENVITFTMLYEGIPVLYYGQEQSLRGAFNPLNREALWLTEYDTEVPLYQLTSKLNGIRSHAIKSNDSYLDYTSSPLYHDDHTLVLRKGFEGNQIITAMTHIGFSEDTYTVNVTGTGLVQGDLIQDVVSCTTMTAGENGDISITFDQGRPRVYYPVGGEGIPSCSKDDGLDEDDGFKGKEGAADNVESSAVQLALWKAWSSAALSWTAAGAVGVVFLLLN